MGKFSTNGLGTDFALGTPIKCLHIRGTFNPCRQDVRKIAYLDMFMNYFCPCQMNGGFIGHFEKNRERN